MSQIKIIAKKDGQEVRGQILSESETETVIQTNLGKLILDTDEIESINEVLNCDAIPVGKYVKNSSGIYLKIDKQTFRLVRGTVMAPVDVGSIVDGVLMEHSEVFPE